MHMREDRNRQGRQGGSSECRIKKTHDGSPAGCAVQEKLENHSAGTDQWLEVEACGNVAAPAP